MGSLTGSPGLQEKPNLSANKGKRASSLIYLEPPVVFGDRVSKINLFTLAHELA